MRGLEEVYQWLGLLGKEDTIPTGKKSSNRSSTPMGTSVTKDQNQHGKNESEMAWLVGSLTRRVTRPLLRASATRAARHGDAEAAWVATCLTHWRDIGCENHDQDIQHNLKRERGEDPSTSAPDPSTYTLTPNAPASTNPGSSSTSMSTSTSISGPASHSMDILALLERMLELDSHADAIAPLADLTATQLVSGWTNMGPDGSPTNTIDADLVVGEDRKGTDITIWPRVVARIRADPLPQRATRVLRALVEAVKRRRPQQLQSEFGRRLICSALDDVLSWLVGTNLTFVDGADRHLLVELVEMDAVSPLGAQALLTTLHGAYRSDEDDAQGSVEIDNRSGGDMGTTIPSTVPPHARARAWAVASTLLPRLACLLPALTPTSTSTTMPTPLSTSGTKSKFLIQVLTTILDAAWRKNEKPARLAWRDGELLTRVCSALLEDNQADVTREEVEEIRMGVAQAMVISLLGYVDRVCNAGMAARLARRVHATTQHGQLPRIPSLVGQILARLIPPGDSSSDALPHDATSWSRPLPPPLLPRGGYVTTVLALVQVLGPHEVFEAGEEGTRAGLALAEAAAEGWGVSATAAAAALVLPTHFSESLLSVSSSRNHPRVPPDDDEEGDENDRDDGDHDNGQVHEHNHDAVDEHGSDAEDAYYRTSTSLPRRRRVRPHDVLQAIHHAVAPWPRPAAATGPRGLLAHCMTATTTTTTTTRGVIATAQQRVEVLVRVVQAAFPHRLRTARWLLLLADAALASLCDESDHEVNEGVEMGAEIREVWRSFPKRIYAWARTQTPSTHRAVTQGIAGSLRRLRDPVFLADEAAWVAKVCHDGVKDDDINILQGYHHPMHYVVCTVASGRVASGPSRGGWRSPPWWDEKSPTREAAEAALHVLEILEASLHVDVVDVTTDSGTDAGVSASASASACHMSDLALRLLRHQVQLEIDHGDDLREMVDVDLDGLDLIDKTDGDKDDEDKSERSLLLDDQDDQVARARHILGERARRRWAQDVEAAMLRIIQAGLVHASDRLNTCDWDTTLEWLSTVINRGVATAEEVAEEVHAAMANNCDVLHDESLAFDDAEEEDNQDKGYHDHDADNADDRLCREKVQQLLRTVVVGEDVSEGERPSSPLSHVGRLLALAAGDAESDLGLTLVPDAFTLSTMSSVSTKKSQVVLLRQRRRIHRLVRQRIVEFGCRDITDILRHAGGGGRGSYSPEHDNDRSLPAVSPTFCVALACIVRVRRTLLTRDDGAKGHVLGPDWAGMVVPFVEAVGLDAVRLLVALGSVAAHTYALTALYSGWSTAYDESESGSKAGHGHGHGHDSFLSEDPRRRHQIECSLGYLVDATQRTLGGTCWHDLDLIVSRAIQVGLLKRETLDQAYEESVGWMPDCGCDPATALLVLATGAGGDPDGRGMMKRVKISIPLSLRLVAARVLASPRFLTGAVWSQSEANSVSDTTSASIAEQEMMTMFTEGSDARERWRCRDLAPSLRLLLDDHFAAPVPHVRGIYGTSTATTGVANTSSSKSSTSAGTSTNIITGTGITSSTTTTSWDARFAFVLLSMALLDAIGYGTDTPGRPLPKSSNARQRVLDAAMTHVPELLRRHIHDVVVHTVTCRAPGTGASATPSVIPYTCRGWGRDHGAGFGPGPHSDRRWKEATGIWSLLGHGEALAELVRQHTDHDHTTAVVHELGAPGAGPDHGMAMGYSTLDHNCDHDHDDQSCASWLCAWSGPTCRAVLWSFPAATREWFLSLRDRTLIKAIENHVYTCEATHLLQHEIVAAQSKSFTSRTGTGTEGSNDDDDDDENTLRVRANVAQREVIAQVEIEDGAGISLRIRLPQTWPLGLPQVDFPGGVKGVPKAKARRWLLGINVLLRGQNGSVVDALAMWHGSVCRELSGEPCIICYSVLHPQDQSLPRMPCKTCAQVFHGACLYKWFRNSGKSNCPHCQTPW